MAKTNQSASKSESHSKPKQAPVQKSMGPDAEGHGLAHNALGLPAASGIEKQVKQLSDSRIPLIQRQMMAIKIGAMQGNGHLQQVLERAGGGKREEEQLRMHPVDANRQQAQQIQRQPNDTLNVVKSVESSTTRYIVDDDASLDNGQMHKSAFLAQLRDAVTVTADQAFQGTAYSTVGCPYILSTFNKLPVRSTEYIERALHLYAPGATKATSATDYIPHVCTQVRSGISTWLETGKTTGVPTELAVLAGDVSSVQDATGPATSEKSGAVQRSDDPTQVRNRLGRGRPLDGSLRTRMQVGLGTPLDNVTIHTDSQAAQLAREQNARAFTIGNDVVFGNSEYRPGTLVGDAILAHELAHVAQQRTAVADQAPVQRTQDGILEDDANRSAIGAIVSLWGGVADVVRSAPQRLRSGVRLQRCKGPTPELNRGNTRDNPYVSGQYLGKWGETLSESDITGGVEILRPGTEVGTTENGFATQHEASAYAHVVIASRRAQGGVIIRKDGRFQAFTIRIDTSDTFSRENVEEGFDTLQTTGSKVQEIVAFVTTDGHIAPPTVARSRSHGTPVFVRERDRAGGYWHSTQAPSSAGYQSMLRDMTANRNLNIDARGYIALFKGLLKANALAQLQKNRLRLGEIEQQYTRAPRRSKKWQRLRLMIEKDKRLSKHQIRFESNAAFARIPVRARDRAGEPDDSKERAANWERQANEVKAVRARLRAEYPPLGVLDTDEIELSTRHNTVLGRIKAGFADIRNVIGVVHTKVHEEDVPLNKLGPIVDQTLKQMGIGKEKRNTGDPMSVAVLDWLDGQDQSESIITWVGTVLTIALGVAAFFASGGTAILLGAAGGAIGFGTAAYEFERADDLHDAARTSQAGGGNLVADPEAARFHYIMAWVNLVLAGLDLGLAAKAGNTLLKSAKTAEGLAGTLGADALSKLKPEQIVQFDKAMQLHRAGKVAESEKILTKLKGKVDAEVFSEAKSLFGRASTVEDLFGASTKISEDVRKALSNIDEAILKKLASSGDDAVESVGNYVSKAGHDAARFINDVGDDAVNLIVRGGSKARAEADAVFDLYKSMGATRFKALHSAWRQDAVVGLAKFAKEGKKNAQVADLLAKVMANTEITGMESWTINASRVLKSPSQLLDLENSLDDAIKLRATDAATEMEVYYYKGKRLTYAEKEVLRKQPGFEKKALQNIDVVTSLERREWKRVNTAVHDDEHLMNQIYDARLKFRKAAVKRGAGGKQNVGMVDFGDMLKGGQYEHNLDKVEATIRRNLRFDQIAKEYMDKLIIKINGHPDITIDIPLPKAKP